jgi:hypothetical protein
MRRPYLALVTAAGLLLAVGASAEAAGRGGGGPGGTVPTFTPPGLNTTNEGFSNSNSHKSIAIPGGTPSGWDKGLQGQGNQGQGNGDAWKGITGTPPGLSK